MKIVLIATFIFLFLFIPYQSYALSDYVLPYPSVMPGSALYKPHILWERLMAYWYFGNLAQFKYNLKESDKYLVEAKVLCEYKQYLFCYKALDQSNFYFMKAYPFLIKAKNQGKDIAIQKWIFRTAAEKHTEVLQKMRQENPENFLWKPEKASSVTIFLYKKIDETVRSSSL